MTIYAVIVTFLLGTLVGVAGTVLTAEWLAVREDKRRTAAREARRSHDADMDAAVELVADKLDAEVIHIEETS
jgi:hypothetical protein